MKKIISILIIGFTVTSLTTLAFNRPERYQGLQDKMDMTPSLQLQKVVTAEKSSYTCPMHVEIVQDKPGKCSKCKMNLVKKEVAKDLYTCPMHSAVMKDKAGKCPKCKMNLVKKEAAIKI